MARASCARKRNFESSHHLVNSKPHATITKPQCGRCFLQITSHSQNCIEGTGAQSYLQKVWSDHYRTGTLNKFLEQKMPTGITETGKPARPCVQHSVCGGQKQRKHCFRARNRRHTFTKVQLGWFINSVSRKQAGK